MLLLLSFSDSTEANEPCTNVYNSLRLTFVVVLTCALISIRIVAADQYLKHSRVDDDHQCDNASVSFHPKL